MGSRLLFRRTLVMAPANCGPVAARRNRVSAVTCCLSDLCPGPEVFAAWAVSLATSLRSFAAGIVPTQGAVSHRSQPRATIGIQRVADNPAGVIEPKTAFLRFPRAHRADLEGQQPGRVKTPARF